MPGPEKVNTEHIEKKENKEQEQEQAKKRFDYLMNEAKKMNPSDVKKTTDEGWYEKTETEIDAELTQEDINEWIKKISINFSTINKSTINKFDLRSISINTTYTNGRWYMISLSNDGNIWTIMTMDNKTGEVVTTKGETDTLPKEYLSAIEHRIKYTQTKKMERKINIAEQSDKQWADQYLEENINNLP